MCVLQSILSAMNSNKVTKKFKEQLSFQSKAIVKKAKKGLMEGLSRLWTRPYVGDGFKI